MSTGTQGFAPFAAPALVRGDDTDVTRNLEGQRSANRLGTPSRRPLSCMRFTSVPWIGAADAYKQGSLFRGRGQVDAPDLVDRARRQHALKRGGEATMVSLDGVSPASQPPSVDVLALDQALEELSAIDAQQGSVVECDSSLGSTSPRRPKRSRSRGLGRARTGAGAGVALSTPVALRVTLTYSCRCSSSCTVAGESPRKVHVLPHTEAGN